MADSTLPLVIANLVLAALVLVPVGLVLAAGVCHLVQRMRHRSCDWIEIPGVGRIPVLRE